MPHCLCMSLLQLAATTSPMSLSVTCVASFVLLRQQPQHCVVHLLFHVSPLLTALNKHSRERERECACSCLATIVQSLEHLVLGLWKGKLLLLKLVIVRPVVITKLIAVSNPRLWVGICQSNVLFPPT